MNATDWFRPDDLPQLFSALKHAPSGGILVGGQSLVFWADFLKVDLPKTDQPYLTQDADIYGTKHDACVVAEKLSAKAIIPLPGDATPNTAIVRFRTQDGRTLHLDFLGRLIGLEEKEIKETSVPIEHAEYGLFNVLHPRLVLISRISNLKTLREKRNANGISQAQVAIPMIKNFFHWFAMRLPENERERHYLSSFEWLAKIAVTEASLICYQKWGIDIMEASPAEYIKSTKFHEIRVPQVNTLIQAKRIAYNLSVSD